MHWSNWDSFRRVDWGSQGLIKTHLELKKVHLCLLGLSRASKSSLELTGNQRGLQMLSSAAKSPFELQKGSLRPI